MEAFTRLTAVAAPFPFSNVDTDAILPARFMKTLARTGLGTKLFCDLRYDTNGDERPDFVLNRGLHRRAQVLVAYENFGCGSSREHAPWALLDFGIRCVIAPSFGDIFSTNCFKNGILPIALPRAACEQLMRDTGAGVPITVDLEQQRVVAPYGRVWEFQADPFRRGLLLQGYDEIDVTLQHGDTIAAYEERRMADGAPFPCTDGNGA